MKTSGRTGAACVPHLQLRQQRQQRQKRKWSVGAIAVMLLLLLGGIGQAGVAAAEDPEVDPEGQIPSCGSVSTYHSLWQSEGRRRVEGIAETSRDWNGCFGTVRVEAWVQGLS